MTDTIRTNERTAPALRGSTAVDPAEELASLRHIVRASLLALLQSVGESEPVTVRLDQLRWWHATCKDIESFLNDAIAAWTHYQGYGDEYDVGNKDNASAVLSRALSSLRDELKHLDREIFNEKHTLETLCSTG